MSRYSHRLHSATGDGPFTWSATGLPPGMRVDGDHLAGTPTAGGQYTVSLRVVDAYGRPATKQLPLSVGVTTPAMRAMFGKIVVEEGSGGGTGNDTSWYIDERGGRHAIPDGGTYECLAAQGIPIYDGAWQDVHRFGTPFEPAECVRAEPGDLVTHANGDSYLITPDWTRQWITDGTTFRCLEVNGHGVVRNVPRYWIMDLDQVADRQWNCWDAAAAPWGAPCGPMTERAGTSTSVTIATGSPPVGCTSASSRRARPTSATSSLESCSRVGRPGGRGLRPASPAIW